MVAYFAETLAHEMRGGIFEASTDGDGKSRPTSSSARLRAKGITTIVQLLQGEELPFRLALVRLLAGTPSREASVALAQRTLFDTSEYIREEAVTALKSRPAAECRPILLEGLRYPWAPVADHAAEALVALRDKEAISNLVDLLELSDPAAPVERADSKWIKPQLVRINHVRNCLLCHSPSFDRKDLVRGPVPTRSEPLPRIYYANFKGPAIRADVTYLRQDFSVLQNVPEPGKWPERQRFDYVIRQRELTSDELRAYQAAERSAARTGGLRTYPQRQAVLFALRELTGKDAGASALAWRRLIPGMMNTFGRKPKT